MKATMTKEEAFSTLKPGIKLKVKQDYNGFKKEDVVTVTHINFGSPIYIYVEEKSNNYLTPSKVELLPQTVKQLEEDIKSLRKDKKYIDLKISETKSKIDFMKENGLKEYDENQYKVFKTLEALEDPSTTRVQKAKIIANMVNS